MPFDFSTSVPVGFGDSTTAGESMYAPIWVDLVNAELAPDSMPNEGFFGLPIGAPGVASSAFGYFTTEVLPYIASNPGKVPVCIVSFGTNDDKSGGKADLVAQNYEALCNLIRGSGFYVIATTLIQDGGDRDTFSAIVRANWSRYADGLADINAVTVATHDGTHPDVSGNAAMAGVIGPATQAAMDDMFSAPSITEFPPSIDNQLPFVGLSLKAHPGYWKRHPTGFAYQWRRDGANISGATSESYTCDSADIGATISVSVVATNTYGSSGSELSGDTQPVAATDPLLMGSDIAAWEANSIEADDGNPVEVIPDPISGYDQVQANADKQFTLFRNRYAGHSTYRADGIDDVMGAAFALSGAFTTVVVVRRNFPGTPGTIFDGYNLFRALNYMAGPPRFFRATVADGGSGSIDNDAYTETDWSIIITAWNGSSSFISINGVVTTGTLTTAETGGITLGAWGDGAGGGTNGQRGPFEYAEVRVIGRGLTQGEASDLDDLLTLKYTPAVPEAPAPSLTAASIDTAGTTLSLTFDQSVTGVSASDYGLTGGTLSSATGIGTAWSMSISPTVYQGASPTLSYSGTATVNGGGTPMATFSGAAVTNNSTQEAVPVDVEPARYGDSDNILFLKWAMRIQDPVAPPSPPVNLSAPVITSSSTEGSQPLNVESEGTWTNSPTSFTYQWHDNGGPIPDATESYIFGNAPSSFHCEVTAINAGGSSSPAQSNTITLS